MDRLKQIRIFTEVARAQSFSATARRFGMSRASVTKHIAALEQAFSVLLLNRTTQHVVLTETGRQLMEGGMRLLEDFDLLEARIRSTESEPRGTIRVGTPPTFGATRLMPAVVAFTKKYPDIRVALHLDNGSADLVRDSLDVSLRITNTLRDSSHVARFLVHVPQVLVAAQSYLDAHGSPQVPSDLLQHNCLVHRMNAPVDTWRFGKDGGGQIAIQVSGSISSNFGEVLRTSALLGAGISLHAIYMVEEDIRAGRLQVVMPDFEPLGFVVNAIYSRRNPPARVSMFLDFLREWFPRSANSPHGNDMAAGMDDAVPDPIDREDLSPVRPKD
jgi:DNA-binding transcriptional LysR family regulator